MKTQMISDSVANALQEQIGEERYNSSLYLSMFSYLSNKGLPNLAEIFMEHHNEETEHSIMISVFLSHMGFLYNIPSVGEVISAFSSAEEVGKLFVEREIATTKSLASIKDIAIDESDSVSEEFLRHMISLQTQEYEESGDFLARATAIGDDEKILMLWDLEIGE